MKKNIQSIAIYCGSNLGSQSIYCDAARELAEVLTQAGIKVIYGGGNVGLMGILADRVLSLNGEVIGVIPESLVAKEVAHIGLTELHIVNTMHERKALMSNLSDGFIMLPGGPGTWEEFFEMMTAAKLGHHQKPCAILNTNNYYDLILKFLNKAMEEQFLDPTSREMILVDNQPQQLLNQMLNYTAPIINPWINKVRSLEVIGSISDS